VDDIGTADCIFCGILAGERPATFVYRDETIAAFMDIQPVNPGHVLVVPVRHATYLADLTSNVAASIMRIGHRLAAALRKSDVRCEGVNFFLADGEAAMQEVLHAHLHVFPRYRGDGFGLRFGPHYSARPPRAELDRIGAQLRAEVAER
jgi:histidine triad (HIT) family protein